MKRTLFTALLSFSMASAVTAATTTTFTDLSKGDTKNGITFTAPETAGGLAIATGNNLYSDFTADSHTQYEASISLTLDVSKLNSLTTANSSAMLFRYDAVTTGTYNDHDFSLWVVNDGGTIKLRSGHSNGPWVANNSPMLAISGLETFGDGIHTLVAITVTYKGINNTSGTKGMQVYSNKNSSSLLNASGLGGRAYEISFGNLEINTTYVTAFAAHNAALSGADAQTATINLMKAIPEPATATLSLLALAGLAARRRRK